MIESQIDLYDTDRLAINKVVRQLQEQVGTVRDGRSFAREVMDRFAEAGYYVDVSMGSEIVGGQEVLFPSIMVTGRTEDEQEFDHDRMGHEVRSNILGEAGRDNVQKKAVGQTGFSSTKSGLIVPK